MEVERIVYKDKFVEIDRVREVPMIQEKVVKVERIVEVPIEVIKIQEVIKEVEKIVYQGGGGGRGAGGGAGGMSDEDCDCLTGARFLAVWNKLFKLSGPSTEECITEDQFISLISKSFNKNLNALGGPDSAGRNTIDSNDQMRMSNSTNFASTTGFSKMMSPGKQ